MRARPETISAAIAANVCTRRPLGWSSGSTRDGDVDFWEAHHAECLRKLKILLKDAKRGNKKQ